MKRSILLLSSSSVHGYGFLQHSRATILSFLDGLSTPVLFVPYAAGRPEWDDYTNKVRHFFTPLAISVTGIHTIAKEAITDFEVIFIGGGNTFRLLHTLQQQSLLPPIREAVMAGKMSYMGSSAGTNMAGKTICTTNDMPIIYPQGGFDALNLFPCQINPHYIDADPDSKHKGETREQRIAEYHQENDTPVIGLREGAYLHLNTNFATTKELFIGGEPGAKMFYKGKAPFDVAGNQKFVFRQ